MPNFNWQIWTQLSYLNVEVFPEKCSQAFCLPKGWPHGCQSLQGVTRMYLCKHFAWPAQVPVVWAHHSPQEEIVLNFLLDKQHRSKRKPNLSSILKQGLVLQKSWLHLLRVYEIPSPISVHRARTKRDFCCNHCCCTCPGCNEPQLGCRNLAAGWDLLLLPSLPGPCWELVAPGAGLGSFLLLLLDAEGVLCLLCCCCSTGVEVGEKEVRTPSWWGWGSCTLLLGRGSPVFSSLCLKMCLGKGEEISAFF